MAPMRKTRCQISKLLIIYRKNIKNPTNNHTDTKSTYKISFASEAKKWTFLIFSYLAVYLLTNISFVMEGVHLLVALAPTLSLN